MVRAVVDDDASARRAQIDHVQPVDLLRRGRGQPGQRRGLRVDIEDGEVKTGERKVEARDALSLVTHARARLGGVGGEVEERESDDRSGEEDAEREAQAWCEILARPDLLEPAAETLRRLRDTVRFLGGVLPDELQRPGGPC